MSSFKKLCSKRLLTGILNYQYRLNSSNSLNCLSPLEKSIQTSVQKFSQNRLAPLVQEMDEKGKFNEDLVKDLFSNGFMGIEVDEKYGGTGANLFCTILVIEELAKVDPSVSVPVAIQNSLINELFSKFGTEEQKNVFLNRLTQSSVGSFCLTEPTSGSDAFSLKSTAKKDGDDFLLNGTKMWISNSDIADIFLVMANANPALGHKGITCFIVERNSIGFNIGKREKKLGLNASGTCMLHLDNVRVPKDSVLGGVGQGYKCAVESINGSRIGIGAQMIGLAQGCLAATIPYTLERHQFGSPIYSFQSIQHEISRLKTKVEAAKLLVYNAARLLEAGENIIMEASMAKFFSSEVAQEVANKCIDLVGGIGISKDFALEKYYRDSKIGTIYEGSTNIQLSTIAKQILKQHSK